MGITGNQMVNFQYAMTVVTFVLVATRIYVQIRRPVYPTAPSLLTRITLEALVIVAWLFLLVEAIADTYVGKLGGYNTTMAEVIAPTHQNTIKRKELLKLWYALIVIYLDPMYAIKCHFVLLYHAVLIPKGTSMRKLRFALWVTTICVVGTWISSTVIAMFGCGDVKLNWANDGTFCSAMGIPWAFGLYFGPHVATDLMVYLLPIPVLYHIKGITVRQRIYAGLTFGFGFLCVAVALVQVIFNLVPTLSIADAYLLMVLERTWAITAACVPAFKLFFRRGVLRRDGDPESLVSKGFMRGKGVSGGTSISQDKLAVEMEFQDPERRDGGVDVGAEDASRRSERTM